MAFPYGTPQGPADLTVHVHNTFIRKALQANIARKAWAFLLEGSPYAHMTGANTSVPIEGALAVDTTALPATEDPTPLTTSEEAALIPVAEYGDFILITRDAIEQKDMDTIEAKTGALTEHMVKTVDLLCGTPAIAGSNVYFQNGRANANALQAGDVIDAQSFVRARATLRTAGADQYADGYYRAIISSVLTADLFNNGANTKGFLDQSRYAEPGKFITAEVGRFHGFAVYESDQLTLASLAAATGTADMVRAVFAGREFLKMSEKTRPGFRGLAPAGDQLERFWRMSWYGKFGFGRIKESHAIRHNFRSPFAPNP